MPKCKSLCVWNNHLVGANFEQIKSAHKPCIENLANVKLFPHYIQVKPKSDKTTLVFQVEISIKTRFRQLKQYFIHFTDYIFVLVLQSVYAILHWCVPQPSKYSNSVCAFFVLCCSVLCCVVLSCFVLFHSKAWAAYIIYP